MFPQPNKPTAIASSNARFRNRSRSVTVPNQCINNSRKKRLSIEDISTTFEEAADKVRRLQRSIAARQVDLHCSVLQDIRLFQNRHVTRIQSCLR